MIVIVQCPCIIKIDIQGERGHKDVDNKGGWFRFNSDLTFSISIWQGVKAVKRTNLKPKYVFIKPPSLATLEKRLRDRGTETEESLQKRWKKYIEQQLLAQKVFLTLNSKKFYVTLIKITKPGLNFPTCAQTHKKKIFVFQTRKSNFPNNRAN